MNGKGLNSFSHLYWRAQSWVFESSFCQYSTVRACVRSAAQPLNPKVVLCMKWLQKWSFCQQGWRSVWACSLCLWSTSSAQALRGQYVSFCALAKCSSPMSAKGGILKRSNPAINQPGFQLWNASSRISLCYFQHQASYWAHHKSLHKIQFVAESKPMAPCRKILMCC